MGYCIRKIDSDFFIAADELPNVLQAIRSLVMGENEGTHYSWVRNHEVFNSVSVGQAVNAFRWIIELDKDRNIVDLYFNAEKYGDDEQLMRVIAPFVKSNSFIEILGEDGNRWRWVFDNGVLKTLNAVITWVE